ncbi:MAG: TraB/GumN family protein [Rhodocyclaceae bacterium]|nr:TraB/GumN family protein [Rhodocyclaceae bacterium]
MRSVHPISTIWHAALPRLVLLAAAVLLSPRLGAAPYEHGVFWQVQAPNGALSHLLGTLHAPDVRLSRLPAPVLQAMAESHQVATELVSDEVSAHRFRRAMMMREPKLPQILGAEDFERVESLLARSGVRFSARPRMKPWAALLVIAQPAGAAGPSMDEAVLTHAREAGKPVRPLESIEEQIASFEGVPHESQVRLLRHASRFPQQFQASVEPLIRAYIAGNLAEMFRINESVLDNAPELRHDNADFLGSVLYSRNRRFVERLEPLLREGGLFAAFGALHLFGDRGVLSLLERRGFRLRRVAR